jgi:hypothetical protein
MSSIAVITARALAWEEGGSIYRWSAEWIAETQQVRLRYYLGHLGPYGLPDSLDPDDYIMSEPAGTQEEVRAAARRILDILAPEVVWGGR